MAYVGNIVASSSGGWIQRLGSTVTITSKKMQESGFKAPYELDKALVATVRHEFV